MEERVEENPWKHKGRVKFIGFVDVWMALIGMSYASYRMFDFYWDIKDPQVSDIMLKPGHAPFYVLVWVVVMVLYLFQMGASCVLYSAVNQEATETDPYVSVQKCHCWLRCSRVVLFVVVSKLCIQPIIMLVGNISYCLVGILFGIFELIFRSAAIFGVKRFVQELQ